MRSACLYLLVLCVSACSSSAPATPTSEVWVPPTRDIAVPAGAARPAGSMSGSRPTTGGSTDDLPAAWTACQGSDECTFVSLGCCDTTAVNRAHRIDAQRSLDASGHPWCAPKSACGPGLDGTWAGTPGTCRESRCVMP